MSMLDSACCHTILLPTLQSAAASTVHRVHPGRHSHLQVPRQGALEDWSPTPRVEVPCAPGTELWTNAVTMARLGHFPLISLDFLSSGHMTGGFTVSPFPVTASVCLNVPPTSLQYLVLHTSTSEINFLGLISQTTVGLTSFLAIHIAREMFSFKPCGFDWVLL